MLNLLLTIIVAFPSFAFAAQSDCDHVLSDWIQSQHTLQVFQENYSGASPLIHSIVTASIANEFAWLNGPPGGGKTSVARKLFEAQIRAMGDEQKKIFVLQFHKLMSESVITGSAKLQSMLDHGKYVIETSSSLVGDQFIFALLDEAEKANPATLTTLLQVMNERKVFLGSKVVSSNLRAGVLTSNKTVAEFIQSSGDRPTFEAVLDRIGVKRHVPNQFGSSVELVDMYLNVINGKALDQLPLPLEKIATLIDKVNINPILGQVATLVTNLDGIFTSQADQSLADIRNRRSDYEYFPANQFTNRSIVKILKIMKASFITKQLMDGIPANQIRLVMENQDLLHLATPALFGGPGEIRLKRMLVENIQIQDEFGTQLKQAKVEWSPFENAVFVTNVERYKEYRFQIKESTLVPSSGRFQADRLQLGSSEEKKLLAEIKKLAKKDEAKIPQFEVDGTIVRLLSQPSIPAAVKSELEMIQKDWNIFVMQANTVAIASEQTINVDEALKKLKEAKEKIEKDSVAITQTLFDTVDNKSLGEAEKLKIYYDSSQKIFQNMSQQFLEVNHVIEAEFVATLAQKHAYLFGGPGGAKTLVSRETLSSLILWENLKSGTFSEEMSKFYQQFKKRLLENKVEGAELFFLQLHKLVPEGVIVGFPKLDLQMKTGKTEYELSTSLAHEKFIYAILDEVEKAHPGFLSILLSVLEEREVFSGASVFKTALRSCSLTSNKTLSEFLDYFEEDRPTGEAIQDRTLNKVWVSNKFSSKETLMQFMLQVESGLMPKSTTPLPLTELAPLAKKVEVDQYILHVLSDVFDSYSAKRLKAEETSRLQNQQDPREFPDYFVKATSKSNRSFLALMKQLPYNFIVYQMAKGVPFEQLRFKFELQDIPVFYRGLGYWTPVKMTPEYDQNGYLNFKFDGGALEALRSSPTTNARWRYNTQQFLDDARDFNETLNESIRSLLTQYREIVAKYPNLFPSLIAPKKN